MTKRFEHTIFVPDSPLAGDLTHRAAAGSRRPEQARRRMLRASLAAAAGMATIARGAFASTGPVQPGVAGARPPAAAAAPGHRRLAFSNTHTGERLDVVYREGGKYLDDALAAIDHLLRDHRTDDVVPIDRTLLDNLASLREVLDTTEPFHVISGYRSPETNAKLAAASGGVARRSLHLQGRAIDIRVPGRELEQVRRAALAMNAGGVGYYGRSDFVHLDTGRVRTW